MNASITAILWSSGLVSFVSLYVAGVAWWNCRRVTRLLRSHSTRSALELSASLAAVESSFASLSKTVKRLSSRQGMEARRAADGTSRVNGEIPLSELTGTEWRRAARAKYIRPGKPPEHHE